MPGHGRATGESVTISGDTSTPPANGTFAVTVTDADHFTVPFTTTVDGTGGTMTPALEPSYSFAPSFNTAAIDTALGVQGGGGSTADDVSALACNLEVTWTIAGIIASTARLPVTVWNDVNKGDEGAADYSNPPYPTPNNVVTSYPLITGLTGGTVTDLDGQVTVGGARLAGHVAALRIGWWRLRVRSGEVEGANYVIPDDDAALVWEKVGDATVTLNQVADMSADPRVFNAAPNNADMRTALGWEEGVASWNSLLAAAERLWEGRWMARKARAEYAGAVYHVLDRGERREHGIDGARRLLEMGLRCLGWQRAELAGLIKWDARKAASAALIRKQTTVPTAWIARELALGHASCDSRSGKTITRAGRHLGKCVVSGRHDHYPGRVCFPEPAARMSSRRFAQRSAHQVPGDRRGQRGAATKAATTGGATCMGMS